jgi:hypothetical protein
MRTGFLNENNKGEPAWTIRTRDLRVLEEYRVKTVSHPDKGDMCANQLNNSERNYCGKIFRTGRERKKGEITTTADVAELPGPRPTVRQRL